MTKEEFKKLLDTHDWYFAMSDSARIRDEGQIKEDNLRQLIKNNPELQELYNEEVRRRFS